VFAWLVAGILLPLLEAAPASQSQVRGGGPPVPGPGVPSAAHLPSADWTGALPLLLLVVLVNGVQQLGAPSWVQPVFNGLALIIAVAAAQLRARRA